MCPSRAGKEIRWRTVRARGHDGPVDLGSDNNSEAYAYAASAELARAIAGRAGPDGLRAVWTGARRSERVAYFADVCPPQSFILDVPSAPVHSASIAYRRLPGWSLNGAADPSSRPRGGR